MVLEKKTTDKHRCFLCLLGVAGFNLRLRGHGVVLGLALQSPRFMICDLHAWDSRRRIYPAIPTYGLLRVGQLRRLKPAVPDELHKIVFDNHTPFC